MSYLQLQLPIFVLALIANITLGTIVFQYASRDRSRILFSLFILAQMFWITSNYFAFQVSINYFLFVSRLTMFFATLHALFFYLFIDNFLNKKPLEYKYKIIPSIFFGIVVALTTLSPLIFSHLEVGADGNIYPKSGPLIPLFGVFVAFYIISGFTVMISRFKKATDTEKQQWKFLTIGFILTFILVLLFSFINFIFLRNIKGVQFGHLYTLPFIVFTAYAMIKHKLLHIKAVLAEIMVIVINSIIFIQLINSQTTIQFTISGLVMTGTLIGGVFLIRSVEHEVQQREQLEILDKELANANEKLQSLDLARAEFISIASHQLRTPPATVKWYLSSIIDGDYGKLTKKVTEQLKKTQNTNNHLISLIEDMLNVSRIERGKMEFLFEPTATEELASFAHEQLIPMAQDKKIKLIYNPPKVTLPKVMADKEKLRQVMNNLIDNAIKYTKEGSVTISLTKDSDNIIFKVTDSGKGISVEDQAAIFQKYTRGKESIKQSAGLGLGLYVAKIIIEQHKGRIWAESAGVGMGSTFAFSIPIKNGLQKTSLINFADKQ